MQADRDTAGCGERETTMAMTTTAAAGRTSASRAFRRPLVAAGLALAVGVGVAAPAAAAGPLAGDAEIGVARAYLPAEGDDAGRLIVEVPVSYPELRGAAATGADEALAEYAGLLRVRLVDRRTDRLLATVRDRNALVLTTTGDEVRLVHRVVLPLAASRLVTGGADAGEIRLDLAARARLDLDDDAAFEDVERDADVQRAVHWRRVA